MVVVWTERAKKRLHALYNYHLEVAGLRTARRITRKITDDAARLSKHPQLGPIEEEMGDKRDIRSLVAQKHYKLLYRVGENAIYIISLFDCRQSPEKMQEEVME